MGYIFMIIISTDPLDMVPLRKFPPEVSAEDTSQQVVPSWPPLHDVLNGFILKVILK